MPEKKEISFFQGVGKFFRSVVAELKKVAWPSRRETFVYTVVVIATCLVLAVIIGLFDMGLQYVHNAVYR